MLIVAFLCALVTSVEGHGRLINPAGRSTMWRYGFQTPHNPNDHQLSCGGFGAQFYRFNGRCGICGDPYGGPRDNEAGGKYATGTIAKTYKQGDVIKVELEITVNHGGWFEFRLCPNNDYRQRASAECLDRNLLQLTDGRTRYTMPTGLGVMSVNLRLPKHVTCSQCVLQWKWNTASNMRCDGSNCCRGCGPQEQFYGCADIAIGTHQGQAVGIRPPVINRPWQGAQINNIKNPPQASIPGSFVPVGSGNPPDKDGGKATSGECKATAMFRFMNLSGDQWCKDNCEKGGFCPQTRCTDPCRVTKTSNVCKALGAISTAADTWCRRTCITSLCPLNYCSKECLLR